MLFRLKDQRLSFSDLTSSFKPYSSAPLPLRSLLVISLRTKRNPFGASLALRSVAQVTPLSRRFLTTTKTLTSRRASLRPFGLCLIASLIPPALRPLRHEHLRRERDEISPGQTLLFLSVPPAHTLTPNARRKYFLRPKAAGSVTRAHGRPVRLWLAPRLRPGDSTQALRIPPRDGHPALPVT